MMGRARASDYAHYDEDDARSRRSPGSRPRSKRRPEHPGAVAGRVVGVDRGRFTCWLAEEPVIPASEAGAPYRPERLVVAVKARELGRRGLVVGDEVQLVGDLSGDEDTLARIIRRDPRRTALRRTADDADPVERVVVANADQLAIVVAIAEPEPSTRLIDRCLVAALDGALAPLLVVTKADLGEPAQLVAAYRALDVPAVAVQRGDGLEPMRERLQGRWTAFVGSSGVGKTTLVNALIPGTDRTTSAVNAVTGRGRHTSSSAVALELPGGGWVVDTPGLRSFGLAHVHLDRVLHAFPDLQAGTAQCPRGCDHRSPECALDAWVQAGKAEAERLDSLRRLLSSRDSDQPSAS